MSASPSTSNRSKNDQELTRRAKRGSEGEPEGGELSDGTWLYMKLPWETRNPGVESPIRLNEVVPAIRKTGILSDGSSKAQEHDPRGWVIKCHTVEAALVAAGLTIALRGYRVGLAPYHRWSNCLCDDRHRRHALREPGTGYRSETEYSEQDAGISDWQTNV